MWIVLRLLTAVIVGIMRYYWRRTGVDHRKQTGGLAWVLTQTRNKHRIVSTSFGVPFAHPVFFRLSPERGWDRFFKHVGFAHELQTGDAVFDDAIYVACDHPALAPVLQEAADARAAVLALFRGGAQCIYSDGANLWVRRHGGAEPNPADLAQLATVRDALQAVPAADLQTLRDRYFWRALAVGAVAWSLAFYGVPAIFEMLARTEPLYFNWTPVVTLGLGAALGALALLVGLTWLLLRNSSRTHRIFVESALVLLFGVPFSSIVLVSDANISLDRSAPVVHRATVRETYTTITHGKGGSVHIHYYVRLDPGKDPANPLPTALEVTRSVYSDAHQGRPLAVTMRAGALGFPWVQEIRAEP